ncbi:hypothetical protein [Embleya sp. NPDC005575]|uniref:hypothetical protein n=1 Tax=Embleya sp. NPDC005575 TaxID=3156892 RepID=UPI00339F07EB
MVVEPGPGVLVSRRHGQGPGEPLPERETHILAGAPAGSSAAYVAWKGWFWYAQWYTTVEPGLAEPNGGRPWRRLGATP